MVSVYTAPHMALDDEAKTTDNQLNLSNFS
jgi:hypothetical protein